MIREVFEYLVILSAEIEKELKDYDLKLNEELQRSTRISKKDARNKNSQQEKLRRKHSNKFR